MDSLKSKIDELLKFVFIIVGSSILIITTGCANKVRTTGFLSDYSYLLPADGGLRYINMQLLGNYSKFIIDPVVVRLYGIPLGARPDPVMSIALANYMHNAIVNVINDRYMIVSQPAAGVARVRVAITDIERSTPALNVLPQTKLTGAGLGGASMEGEIIDSQTGKQIGAVIQSQKGKMISLEGLTEWGDAKAVMDDWAKRFRKRLDEAHGY